DRCPRILYLFSASDDRLYLHYALLAVRLSDAEFDHGLGPQCPEVIIHQPQVFSGRGKFFDVHDLIAYPQPFFERIAFFVDSGHIASIADHLHIKTVARFIHLARRNKEQMRIVEIDKRLRDYSRHFPDRGGLLNCLLGIFELSVQIYTMKLRIVIILLNVFLDRSENYDMALSFKT